MKPIAIFVLVAAFSVAAVATSAKNATAPGNTNERIVSGVAGPKAAADTSQRTMAAKGQQPGPQKGQGQTEVAAAGSQLSCAAA